MFGPLARLLLASTALQTCEGSCYCGLFNPSSHNQSVERIGGSQAGKHEFPWQALIVEPR